MSGPRADVCNAPLAESLANAQLAVARLTELGACVASVQVSARQSLPFIQLAAPGQIEAALDVQQVPHEAFGSARLATLGDAVVAWSTAGAAR